MPGPGELALDEAAAYPRRSTRQVRRLLAAFAAEGHGALVHRNSGPVPANRLAEATTARVVELARTRDAGFNTLRLAKALAEGRGDVPRLTPTASGTRPPTAARARTNPAAVAWRLPATPEADR